MKYIVVYGSKMIGKTVELADIVNPGDFIIFYGYRQVISVHRIVDNTSYKVIVVGSVLEDA